MSLKNFCKMKKMKNVMVLLLIAAMPMFIACEPINTPTNEDNKSDSTTISFEELIIGKWDCNKYEMKIWVSDNLVTDESISFEPGESGWLIDADGIMMYEDNELYEEKISYRVDGDKLYLEPLSEYETAYYYIRTLTDTELILEWINVYEKVNKYNEKYHFIRVK